jgi:heptaprenyl diphosphate synthase
MILSLLTSQALVLSVIESWLPVPAVVPGVKLGLANIVTLTVIIFFDLKDALLVVIAKSILSSFFTGGFTVMLFSLTGGFLSTFVMYFIYKKGSKYFSTVGISVAGAIMHNIGQLTIASILMQEITVMTYLPILLVSGIVMGCFTGLCTNYMSKLMSKSLKYIK